MHDSAFAPRRIFRDQLVLRLPRLQPLGSVCRRDTLVPINAHIDMRLCDRTQRCANAGLTTIDTAHQRYGFHETFAGATAMTPVLV